MADADEVRRLLDRVPGVSRVHGPPTTRRDEVAVQCGPEALRAVKAKLMREGYSYQARRTRELRDGRSDQDWHVFKESGGGRGRGPFDMFSGGGR